MEASYHQQQQQQQRQLDPQQLSVWLDHSNAQGLLLSSFAKKKQPWRPEPMQQQQQLLLQQITLLLHAGSALQTSI
jgi:hypothetical protein